MRHERGPAHLRESCAACSATVDALETEIARLRSALYDIRDETGGPASRMAGAALANLKLHPAPPGEGDDRARRPDVARGIAGEAHVKRDASPASLYDQLTAAYDTPADALKAMRRDLKAFRRRVWLAPCAACRDNHWEDFDCSKRPCVECGTETGRYDGGEFLCHDCVLKAHGDHG